MLNFTGTVEEIIPKLFKLEHDQEYDFKIAKHSKKRSLNANAYFHLLVNQLARKMNISDDEMKVIMVLSYGTIARDSNGHPVGVKVPRGTDMTRFYPYAKKYAEEGNLDLYLFYERTHLLNQSEMAELISGVVQECRQLGIPTKEDLEIEGMIKEWGDEH